MGPHRGGVTALSSVRIFVVKILVEQCTAATLHMVGLDKKAVIGLCRPEGPLRVDSAHAANAHLPEMTRLGHLTTDTRHPQRGAP